MTLAGHVVLVTGAAGTLGTACADAIRHAGGMALTSDLRQADGVDFVHDVTDEKVWQDVVARIGARHGRLDGLVNAAGIMHVAPVEETTYGDWKRVMAVNADGTFLGCKTCWGLLRASAAPSIVNLSSVSGLVGGAKLAAYNASKGAVTLLTKSVALNGARLDPPIRCNSVHPAFVEGPMVDGIAAAMRNPEHAHDKMRAMVPMGRFARPEEVAATVVHLLCPASGFVTGAEVAVDGGLVAG